MDNDRKSSTNDLEKNDPSACNEPGGVTADPGLVGIEYAVDVSTYDKAAFMGWLLNGLSRFGETANAAGTKMRVHARGGLAALLCLATVFLGVPLPGSPYGGSVPRDKESQPQALGRFLEETLNPTARADFTALANPSAIANFQEFCFDISQVVQIILLFDNAVTLGATALAGSPVTGGLVGLQAKGQLFNNICSLVIAVASANNVAGVLRAVQIANSITGHHLDATIDFFQDSMSLYDFAQNLKTSKQSPKRKILNVSNWSRVLNFAFRWGPLDGIDARRQAQMMAKAEDRANAIADISNAINGCRQPIQKIDSTQVQMPDGPVAVATAARWSSDMDKWVKQRDAAAAKVAEVQKQLNKMIGVVALNKNEIDSSLALIESFKRNSYWVAVGWGPPSDLTVETGPLVTVPNPAVAYQVTNVTSDPSQASTVPIRPLAITKEDTSFVFYVDQGSNQSGFACTDQATFQFENWMANSMQYVNDIHVKGSWLADSVVYCPNTSDDQLGLFNTPISSFHPLKNDSKLQQAIAANTQTMEENCHKRDMDALAQNLKSLNDLSGLRDLSVISDGAPCKKSQAQIDAIAPVGVEDQDDIQNFNDFVNHYNDAFNTYIKNTYDFTLTEGPISDAERSFSNSLGTTMGGGNHGGYSTQSAWDPESSDRMNPQQVQLITQWKHPSLCDIPKYLEEKYPDKKIIIDNMALGEVESKAYLDLVETCLIDDKSVKTNDDIFQSMFVDGYSENLRLLAQAKSEILKLDFLTGSFRATNRKPQTCIDDLKPQDTAKANARGQLVVIDTLEDLVELTKKTHQKNDELDAKNQLNTQAIEALWFQKQRDSDAAALKQAVNAVDVLTNPGYKWGAIAPSLSSVRNDEDTFGTTALPAQK